MEAAQSSTTAARCSSHRGTVQRTTIGRIDMRNLYALVLGASMSLAPAVSFASVTSHETTTHRDSTTLTMPAVANESTSAKAPSDDLARYAARDAASPDAKNYRGGDTVVIGATAATAILAVLLLVILL
jgi:hypothetical protein